MSGLPAPSRRWAKRIPPTPGRSPLRPDVDYRLAQLPYDPVPGVELFSPRAFVHTKHGKIEILLDVIETPLTTASFVDLARRGFYDGLTFHRVEPFFVVQGGCPRGDGNGGPGYTLRSEVSGRPYGRGAVGMALVGKDTGGSQFFITLSPQPHLDGELPALRDGGGGDGGGGEDPARRRDRAGRDLERALTYRLLALDIDGTLLRSDKGLSPRTRRALHEARAAGTRLVLVTGRRYPSARKVAEDLGGDVPLVLHNGALVVEEGKLLRCTLLPSPAAVHAVRIGRARGLDGVLHCGRQGEGQLRIEERALQSRLVGYYLERSRRDVQVVDDLEQAAAGGDVIQVMFGGARDEMDAVWPEVARDLGAVARVERTVYPQIGVGILDVLAPGVSKAQALAFLQERWGIAAAETLAIGDNWNDREMLERAGLGLVMGNADPEMRELGLPVLPSNDEDGVAVAIEAHVLGGTAKNKRG